MMTTEGKVSSQGGEERIPVNVMFDTGSHWSYLLSKTTGKLDNTSQNTLPNKEISLATFGSNQAQKKIVKQIPLQLETSKGPIPLVVWEVETITAPLSASSVNIPPEVRPFLKGREPNNLDTSSLTFYKIHLIVGMDNYHHFIKEPPIKMKENLHLYNTVLGPLIAAAVSKISQESSGLEPSCLEVSSISLNVKSPPSNKKRMSKEPKRSGFVRVKKKKPKKMMTSKGNSDKKTEDNSSIKSERNKPESDSKLFLFSGECCDCWHQHGKGKQRSGITWLL